MDSETFRDWAVRAVEWAADYRADLACKPVRAQTQAGAIASQLPGHAPNHAEDMQAIFADFERIILPGMTHWQHPRFFAYFPANASPVSVIAEILVSTMAAQCMLWQTSPAATELETVMLQWLRQAVGLPEGFHGVIQDSASSASLAAILTMREKAVGFAGNKDGLSAHPGIRIYASDQTHSSIDKAVRIAGIGQDNLVKVPTAGPGRAIDIEALEAAIAVDRAAGLLPAGIVACVGGTSVGAIDDVTAAAAVARRHRLYVHVDAAWAGAAMICPEFRPLWAGIESVDSLVINPHKWLGAQFDCSAHFVRDPGALVGTLAMQPEYLKTYGRDGIINYSEWSIPLGRRFRALKLWFLMRGHGLEGLRTMIRNHVRWSQGLARRLAAEPGFALVTQPVLSLFSFRHDPDDGRDLDAHNLALIAAINDDGRIYLTQTRVDGRVAIRFQAGTMTTTEADIDLAFEVIRDIARKLVREPAGADDAPPPKSENPLHWDAAAGTRLS